METLHLVPWSSDLHGLALRFGSRNAVTGAAGSIDYNQLDRLAHGVAEALAARGIAPGTPVGTFLRNGPPAVWASAGVTLAGACEVPLNPAFTAAELAWCATLAKPALVVTDRTLAAEIVPLGVPVLPVEDVRPAGAAFACAPVPAAVWSRIAFSSGTTGRPKGLVHTHGRRWLANLMLKAALPLHPLPGSRILLVTPFVHGAGLLTGAWLDHGGEVILLEGIDLPRVEAWLASGTLDALFAPPTVIAKLADAFAGRTFTGLKVLFTGTATLTHGLYAKARAMFGPIVRITYGKSENTNPITVLEAADAEACFRDEPDAEGACLGWPAAGVEIAIVDADGRPLPAGADGEIWVRSQREYAGHLDAQGFHPLPPPGGHRSGDLGRIDARGRLWLLGRLADVIKSGGYKLYPQEIEAALSGVPGCSQVAVASVPSDYWGEVVVAAGEGVTHGADWEAAARAQLATLARYKHPRAFVVLDALPRNPQGKISRASVRAAILARYRLEDGAHPRLVPL